MATTINASTSGGLVQTADTSGTLQLQSAGTTQFTVDSTGSYGTLKQATAVTLTTQTSVDFTSIPSWVKRVTVMFGNISGSGTSIFQIRLNSEATGYTSAVGRITPTNFSSGGSSTTGWTLTAGNNASTACSGVATICLLNPATNQYSIFGNMNQNNGASTLNYFTGTKSTSAVLSTITITTVNGLDTFNGGTINIMYEG